MPVYCCPCAARRLQRQLLGHRCYQRMLCGSCGICEARRRDASRAAREAWFGCDSCHHIHRCVLVTPWLTTLLSCSSLDEKDEEFWEEVDDLGWGYIDHEQEGTIKKYGEWYGPIIDIVIHSLAVGFVGTDGSTLSLVSHRRVEDWNSGVTRMVKWGYAGADNH